MAVCTMHGDECPLNEEMIVLEAIYINELDITRNDSGHVTDLRLVLHPATADATERQFVRITVVIRLPLTYPEDVPRVSIENSRGLSDNQLLCLTEALNLHAETCRGWPMLHELIETAKDTLTAGNLPHCPCSICLDQFTEGDDIHKTECYHYYHSDCLLDYVQYYRTNKDDDDRCRNGKSKPKDEKTIPCPICREHIGVQELLSRPMTRESSSNQEVYTPDPYIKALQEKMQELYLKQQAQGGIIDIEAEKNKYLVQNGTLFYPTVSAELDKTAPSEGFPPGGNLAPVDKILVTDSGKNSSTSHAPKFVHSRSAHAKQTNRRKCNDTGAHKMDSSSARLRHVNDKKFHISKSVNSESGSNGQIRQDSNDIKQTAMRNRRRGKNENISNDVKANKQRSDKPELREGRANGLINSERNYFRAPRDNGQASLYSDGAHRDNGQASLHSDGVPRDNGQASLYSDSAHRDNGQASLYSDSAPRDSGRASLYSDSAPRDSGRASLYSDSAPRDNGRASLYSDSAPHYSGRNNRHKNLNDGLLMKDELEACKGRRRGRFTGEKSSGIAQDGRIDSLSQDAKVVSSAQDGFVPSVEILTDSALGSNKSDDIPVKEGRRNNRRPKNDREDHYNCPRGRSRRHVPDRSDSIRNGPDRSDSIRNGPDRSDSIRNGPDRSDSMHNGNPHRSQRNYAAGVMNDRETGYVNEEPGVRQTEPEWTNQLHDHVQNGRASDKQDPELEPPYSSRGRGRSYRNYNPSQNDAVPGTRPYRGRGRYFNRGGGARRGGRSYDNQSSAVVGSS